ncbi:hypothetical protein [Thalassobellus suaedae]|uniref:Uncharacterized protein n=1 Tax=Thalassobellus suaedae TaxID=3074124 RepID=A0ABY9XWN0_9FLAO|nr:hypothetical protein RHP51_04875 [Flavobacteriaceae bacterium HL-DH14]
MKQVLIDTYWGLRKVLFYAFVWDDKCVSIDFIWYNILDSRNGKLIIDSINLAKEKGLKEVTVKLYNHEPIQIG